MSITYEPVVTTSVTRQISEKIRESILDGRLKADDRLPTEHERDALTALRDALVTHDGPRDDETLQGVVLGKSVNVQTSDPDRDPTRSHQ